MWVSALNLGDAYGRFTSPNERGGARSRLEGLIDGGSKWRDGEGYSLK
jgi:hypothetical protein